MKIRSLEIEGFRGIGRLRLDFDPRLTVIVGENGVGKTSVLDALAILLDNYVARFIKASAQKAERLRDTDVNSITRETKLALTVAETSDSFEPTAKWILRKQERYEKLMRPKGSELDGLNALVKRRAEARGDVIEGEPLMIYYGQRRAVLDIPQRIKGASKQSSDAAFSDALKLGDLNFREFVAWFRDRSLEEAQHWRDDRTFCDTQLEAVRQAMTRVSNMTSPRYRVDTPAGLCVTKNGIELRVDQLSSGEQSFLALAGDLARRLAMLNPKAPDPLVAPGIVLIDEVELHLHPRWQRRIIPWLLETFTNCQFIISTHSPQVLGRVHADNIRVLRKVDGQIENYEVSASYGRDSNYILLSVLGGGDRDLDIKDRLSELEVAIARGQLDRAQTLLDELHGTIEGGAPELALAEHRLERMRRSHPQ